MRQGHHHGPHLGHRPWRVAVSANVGACLAMSSGRGWRIVRSIARTEDRQRLAACLFSECKKGVVPTAQRRTGLQHDISRGINLPA